jgi:cell division transport system ATP-binding protein
VAVWQLLETRLVVFARVRSHRYPEPAFIARRGDSQPPMSDQFRLHQAVSDAPPPAFGSDRGPQRTAVEPPPVDTPRPASQAMILFDGVTKTYQGGVVGLSDVSVQIDKGEFVFLVGPSGSGKSTFIKLLLKELDATSGNLIVGGRSLPKLKRSKVPTLRRNIGCVFQDFKLLPNRTVSQNVAYALQVQGKSRAEIRKKVPDIIGLVGLADKSDRYPHELSGGEQQRVSVARAFVNHPPLLIADEPTGNLDPDTSVGIMQLLYRINRAGTTVVMATHDREMVDKMRRRVIQLEDGRVVRDDRRGGYEG